MTRTIYEAAGGYDAFLRLAHVWHEQCLADEIVSHAFSHGYHPQHSGRLASYWAEAMGGPATYTAEIGDEAAVVRMHSGNGPHEEMDERAIACFERAVEAAGLPDDAALRATIVAYFRWSIERMNVYAASKKDVPPTLPFARWSWDGPVR